MKVPVAKINTRVQWEEGADGLPFPQRIWAVVAAALALIMSVIDGTIVNVALPTLADEFGTTPGATIWIVNAYQLVITVSLLSFSFLGDIYGYRKVFLSGIAVFCVASLACALSDSFWMLTAARVLQGFGASAITSVNTAQLRTFYPKRMIGRGMSINAMVVAVSIAAGPSVASAVLSLGSWHWLFALNVPLAIAAFIMGYCFLPRRRERVRGKFDRVSSISSALTFGLLIYTLEGIAHNENRLFVVLQVLALGLIGTVFIRRQLKMQNPMLPVDLMRIPIFSLSIATSVCSFTAQMLAMVSLPFFFQDTLGRSAVEIGLLLTPWPLATLVTAPVAGILVECVHPGLLGCFGMVIFATGLLLLALLPGDPTNAGIIWRLVLCGMGFGLFQTPNNTTIISSAPVHRSGGASGMLGMARLLGQTLGTTLVALLFGLLPHERTTTACLLLGMIFAIAAAVVSTLRLSQAAPLKKTNG